MQFRELDVSDVRHAVVWFADTNSRTYDEYVSELASGRPSWMPVHRLDGFWRENASKLNERDHEQLKLVLLHMLTLNWPLNYLLFNPHLPIEHGRSRRARRRSARLRTVCQTLRARVAVGRSPSGCASPR